LLEGIPATSVMSPDQRTLVPQEETSGEEAMVERGATEVVGAEVETEVATEETEVAVAATEETEVAAAATEEIEVGVAMVETEVGAAMVGTEEAVMEETEAEATVETEAAMEAKWEEGEY